MPGGGVSGGVWVAVGVGVGVGAAGEVLVGVGVGVTGGDVLGGGVGLTGPTGNRFSVPDLATTARQAAIEAASLMLVAGTARSVVRIPNRAPLLMR